ncbi:MAG: hypothetical protein Q4C67_02720 [Deinococcus sp.]|nr:hypothetical protein [Deinococcus sp.]
MTDRAPLELVDPMTYTRPGEDWPNLYPLPVAAHPNGPRDAGAHAVWADYWVLPKAPLMVTAELAWEATATREPGPHHLDAALSVAQLRAADMPWRLDPSGASVIPLPLALLGVVRVDETPRRRKTWPKLPVWAATPFQQVAPGRFSALCVGHLGAVGELVSYLHEIGATPARFSVELAPMSESDALDAIRQARPMPGRDTRWTPPYWFDWENRFDRAPDTGADHKQPTEDLGPAGRT